ncbi:MAG: FkbM family methyltransferase [Cyanobacteriota bacterium]|jgi:FkbM family methyltransferase
MNEAELRFDNDVPRAHEKAIIYDIGANNGDDIPYYLKKADVVVAVEANPDLCRQMRERFPSEIQQGRLVIENCVLTSEGQGETVPFYVHKTVHVRSQFPPPRHNPDEFERVLLPGKSVSQLIEEHGYPYYIKIDIEHYDHILLRSLFKSGIRPFYLSAESHNIEVFLLLTSLGGYNSFKVVNGSSVANEYCNYPIKTIDGEEVYSFLPHSAGPFGEDVAGSWTDSAGLFRRLQSEGLGWKDIHAKRDNSGGQKWQSRIPWLTTYWYYKVKWIPVSVKWVAIKAYRKIKRNLFKKLSDSE